MSGYGSSYTIKEENGEYTVVLMAIKPMPAGSIDQAILEPTDILVDAQPSGTPGSVDVYSYRGAPYALGGPSFVHPKMAAVQIMANYGPGAVDWIQYYVSNIYTADRNNSVQVDDLDAENDPPANPPFYDLESDTEDLTKAGLTPSSGASGQLFYDYPGWNETADQAIPKDGKTYSFTALTLLGFGPSYLLSPFAHQIEEAGRGR